ncbi:MAG TPA: amidohydrolase [Gemmataceae bacterium]|nr:amidohydrolase [Gemmataceae bacterium]
MRQQRRVSNQGRNKRVLLMAAALTLLTVSALPGEDRSSSATTKRVAAVKERLAADYERMETLYKHLHSNPELSLHEAATSARLAQELKAIGFDVTQRVGGYGLVGVLKNGDGPTVMVRTDMDALPVIERTGLPYASKVRKRDKNENEVGVMHACGHDMHMTVWTGTARVLASMKDRWKGTLLFIAQPAEEIGAGARMMLEAGLFKKFPRPDYAFALHCAANLPHGSVAYTEGLAMANVDSVDIIVHGKGGHGAAPHTTIDPVVLAARIVLDLQTLVSREINPIDPAVVTVGSIHGGSKHNIIPNDVHMQLTVRSTKDSVRKHLLDGIRRIAEAAAKGAGAPLPEVKVNPAEFTPALHNDPALTSKTVAVFKEVLGPDKVVSRPPMMGGEDFSRYGRARVPICLFWLGTIDPKRVAEAEKDPARPLPSLHSDLFAPVPEPTIKTGVLAMSVAVLHVLGK